ncbi:Holliday junction branch migration protein RuvA [Eubacteriales bacterium OttesenSCG-928-K08]|nr:Holliday junction branch migration protein RuvA [Eubacteriales bacterium OttesenSCG-928-K08]
MYAHIRGEVVDIQADRAVLEACGVGYELNCSTKTLGALKKGTQAQLYTHLHLAEDIMALYGFENDTERFMFRRLLTVTRVGPKLALSVLSTLTPSDVAAAIITDNADAFARVPGMGKKTAQRVLLELKEKIGAQEMVDSGLSNEANSATDSNAQAEAVAALISLGYDGASASRAVAQIKGADSLEQLITLALRSLARQ